MFHALRGLAQYEMGKVKKAYEYLSNALELGETEQNHKVMGYACSWLAWVCTELGQIDDSILFGERAKELSKVLESEEYLFFNSLAGMGLAYYYKGERMRAYEVGKDLLEYGQRNANIRSLVLGHFVIGCSYLLAGVFPSAIKCFQRSVKVSADPWYCQFPRLFLGLSYILAGEFQDAENTLNEVLKTSHHLGTDLIGTPARSLMAIVSIARGSLSRGLRMLEDTQKQYLENGRRYVYAVGEHIMGKLYGQIAEGAPISLSAMKNIGFLVKNIPVARKKAEDHLNRSIEVAKEIGAQGMLGMVYLDSGLLQKARGKKDRARQFLTMAIEYLEQCEAESYLEQARDALESLG
jgi:tetratricopeptide (TPR) repeat protein